MNRRNARLRRGIKTKTRIYLSNRPRLVVYRSGYHIYGQIVCSGENGDIVIASASTMDKELKANLKSTKVEQALQVGKLLGDRAKAKSIDMVSFDRAGYKYHGRVAAVAKGAREAGLEF